MRSVPPVRNWSACIFGCDSDAQKGDEVASTFCAVSGQAVQHTAFAQKVAEHQKKPPAPAARRQRPAITVTTTGNRMRRTVRLLSFASYGMRIMRSFLNW